MATETRITYAIHEATKNVEVATRTYNDGEQTHIHRHVLAPGADLTNEHPDVAAAAVLAWADLPED
jgi:hypothetical protein